MSPAFPGLFLAFAATVLFVFASVTPPAWDRYGFMDVTTDAGRTQYGVFGLCVKEAATHVCTHRSVGYNITAAGVSSDVNLNTTVLHNLTYALILHPIAAGVAFIAFLFGLIGVLAASRIATIFMGLFALIGSLVALVVFVIDMVLWNVLKNRLVEHDYDANLGIANWITLGGVVALLLATCAGFCGACGRFATGRPAGEKF